jgi:hypothetical protein
MKARPSRIKANETRLPEQRIWCGICHIRVAPYEMAVRVMKQIYHAHCLDHLRHRTRKIPAEID